MRFFVPLALVVSLGLVSCREEAKVGPVGQQDEVVVELASLKADLTRLQNQWVSEQNERLKKDTEQAAVFAELAAVMKELRESSKAAPEVLVEKVGVPAVNEEDEHAAERRLAREMEKQEIDESLQRLAEAVADLQRQAAEAPRQEVVEGGIIVNPPIIVHDNRFFQNGLDCPPVIRLPLIHPPIIRTPNPVAPTIRDGGSPPRSTPGGQRPAATPTIQRPETRAPEAATATPRPRITPRPSTSAPVPTVGRPVSRSSATATPVPRATPTIQRARPAPSSLMRVRSRSR